MATILVLLQQQVNFTVNGEDVNETVTLTPSTYGLIFNGATADELSGLNFPLDYSLDSEDINLTNVPDRASETFTGWFDQDGNKVETIAKGSYGELTLTAQWRAKNGQNKIPVNSVYVTPSNYPEKKTRNGYAPTWKDMGNRMNYDLSIWGVNNLPLDFGLAISDGWGWHIGTVLAEKSTTIGIMNFDGIGKADRLPNDSRERLKAKYSDGYIQMLIDIAKNGGVENAHYFGPKIGETDQVFCRAAPRMASAPVPRTRRKKMALFNDFIDAQMEGGNADVVIFEHAMFGYFYTPKEQISSLISTQFWNSPRGGASSVVMTNCRGASKQYGDLIDAQFSQMSSAKLDENSQFTGDYNMSQCDLSYARQMYYYGWLTNLANGRWEIGSHYPFTDFFSRAEGVTREIGRPGVVQTPIALVLDFYNGWQVPWGGVARRNVWYNEYKGYEECDYQTHGLLEFYYNNYTNAAGGNIYKHMTPTPYGSSTDILYSDVQPSLLERYGLVVWAGEATQESQMIKDKLESFANYGRDVVIFGKQAEALFPQWFSGSSLNDAAAGTVVQWEESLPAGNTAYSAAEPNKFQYYNGVNLPAEVVTLATVNGTPLVVEIPYQNNGRLSVVLSPYGMNKDHLGDKGVSKFAYNMMNFSRRLLDLRSTEKTLFKVNNDKLNYVASRVKAGEYYFGVFNAEMTSQPFTIESNIGTITNIEEVDLNSDKELVKHFGGGRLYTPKHLSPTTNYGLSDASNIEGRDVRIFKISVSEENVEEMPYCIHNGRPEERYVAMPDLAVLRNRIPEFYDFFFHYNGVKIDGETFLNTSDDQLTKSAKYLNRRVINTLVDARNITDEADLQIIVDRLITLKRAVPTLVADSVSSAIATQCTENGIRLLAGSEVCWINKTHGVDQAKIDSAQATVVDLYYETMDALYNDVKTIFINKESGLVSLEGETVESVDYDALQVTQSKSGHYIYIGRETFDLKKFVAENIEIFTKFEGLKVDASYIINKTDATLIAEKAWLDSKGLKLIVDLTSEQNHCIDISLYKYFPSYIYNEGLNIYDEVLRKMELMGSTELIMEFKHYEFVFYSGDSVTQVQREANETMVYFAEQAKAKNINLHIQYRNSWVYNAEFPRIADHNNIYIMNPDSRMQSRINSGDQQLSPFVMYPFKNDIGSDSHPHEGGFPLKETGKEIATSDYSRNLIMNAYYYSTEEIMADMVDVPIYNDQVEEEPVLKHCYTFNDNAEDTVGGAHLNSVGSAEIVENQAVFSGGAARTNCFKAESEAVDKINSTVDAINIGSKAMTIESWFTLTEDNNDWRKLFGLGSAKNNQLLFTVKRLDSGNKSAAEINTGSGEIKLPALQLQSNTQYYMAITYEEQGDIVILRIASDKDKILHKFIASLNGNKLSELIVTDFYIGCDAFWGNDSIQGTVNEFRIWDGKFNDAKAQTSFESGVSEELLAVNEFSYIPLNTTTGIDVLSNDSGSGSILSATDAKSGTVRIVDGIISYTPNSNFFGYDHFTYTITNGIANDSATVSVQVGGAAVSLANPDSDGNIAHFVSASNASSSRYGDLSDQTSQIGSNTSDTDTWEIDSPAGAAGDDIGSTWRMGVLVKVGHIISADSVDTLVTPADLTKIKAMTLRLKQNAVGPANSLDYAPRAVLSGVDTSVSGTTGWWGVSGRACGGVTSSSNYVDGIWDSVTGEWVFTLPLDPSTLGSSDTGNIFSIAVVGNKDAASNESISFSEVGSTLYITTEDVSTTPAIGLELTQTDNFLEWTVEDEINVKEYLLIDADGNIVAKVPADNSGKYSLVLDSDELVSLIVVDNLGHKQTFKPEDGNEQITTYDLTKGWNLISITSENADLEPLKDATAGVIWGWTGTAYELIDSAEPTDAVWVYCSTTKQVDVTGRKSGAEITLESGWNMVGPVENSYIPEDAISVFSWNDTYNTIAGEDKVLIEGVGYWIFAL